MQLKQAGNSFRCSVIVRAVDRGLISVSSDGFIA